MYKYIINLGVMKYMTSYRVTYETYMIIDLCNIYLDNDSVVKTIRMGSNIVKVVVRSKIK